MIRLPPRSTLFPTRRSSDLQRQCDDAHVRASALHELRGLSHVFAEDERVGDAVVNPGFLQRGHGSAAIRSVCWVDRKSTRLNSSHGYISYAVFCLKKKKKNK